MTMLNRTMPNAQPSTALTQWETALLDKLIGDTGGRTCAPGTLAFYLIKLARLGGYMARSRDAPPGIVTIWRGLTRLADIALGAELTSVTECG